MYAEPVNWSSSKGEKLSGTNGIIRKQFGETILWKLIQRNLQILKVFWVFSQQTFFIKTKLSEDCLVNEFFEKELNKIVKDFTEDGEKI